MARPKGVRNSKNHNAGGKRPGSGRRYGLSIAAAAIGQQTLRGFRQPAPVPDEERIQAEAAAAAARVVERAAQEQARMLRRIVAADNTRNSLRTAAERAENPLPLEVNGDDSADEYNDDSEAEEDAGAAAALAKQKPKRKTRCVIPADGSSVAVRLAEVKRLATRDEAFRAKLKKGMKWLAPESDPLSQGFSIEGDPGPWYVSNVWI